MHPAGRGEPLIGASSVSPAIGGRPGHVDPPRTGTGVDGRVAAVVADAPGPSPLRVVSDPAAVVDVDTGADDRAVVAARVARARIGGAGTVRTAHPQAARRAAAVIDALQAARADAPDTAEATS